MYLYLTNIAEENIQPAWSVWFTFSTDFEASKYPFYFFVTDAYVESCLSLKEPINVPQENWGELPHDFF